MLCKYEDITIEKIEDIIETKLVKEIIFDADNKTVEISEEYKDTLDTLLDSCDQIRKALEEFGHGIREAGTEMRGYFEKIAGAFLDSDFSPYMNKKITKKRFIKLLQSTGIQRNQINEIIKNNTEKYTHTRLFLTLSKYSDNKKQ